jgi:hypothetical protein
LVVQRVPQHYAPNKALGKVREAHSAFPPDDDFQARFAHFYLQSLVCSGLPSRENSSSCSRKANSKLTIVVAIIEFLRTYVVVPSHSNPRRGVSSIFNSSFLTPDRLEKLNGIEFAWAVRGDTAEDVGASDGATAAVTEAIVEGVVEPKVESKDDEEMKPEPEAVKKEEEEAGEAPEEDKTIDAVKV